MKGEFFKLLKNRNTSPKKKNVCKKKSEERSSHLLHLLVSVQDRIFQGGTQQYQDEYTGACFRLSSSDNLFNIPKQS